MTSDEFENREKYILRTMREDREAARSPCIKVCELDENGICKGCKRTIQEICEAGKKPPYGYW
jgi:hypothetical protein